MILLLFCEAKKLMKFLKIILIALLTIVGSLSVFMTTSVIFDLFGIRKLEGNFVLIVVYANFICGLIYLYAATTIWNHVGKSVISLFIASLILTFTFIWFNNYIEKGGIHEQKTVYAMTFRTIFTFALFVISTILYLLERKKVSSAL